MFYIYASGEFATRWELVTHISVSTNKTITLFAPSRFYFIITLFALIITLFAHTNNHYTHSWFGPKITWRYKQTKVEKIIETIAIEYYSIWNQVLPRAHLETSALHTLHAGDMAFHGPTVSLAQRAYQQFLWCRRQSPCGRLMAASIHHAGSGIYSMVAVARGRRRESSYPCSGAWLAQIVFCISIDVGTASSPKPTSMRRLLDILKHTTHSPLSPDALGC
jgi:hypothetical protein